MPVGLACSRVRAGIEKDEELSSFVVFRVVVTMVHLDALVGNLQVCRLQKMCLFLESMCCEDEVLGNDCELVENEIVARLKVGD
jgi:hypothetical protein